MKVLHLGTIIQTQFGILDEEGNVHQIDPISVKLPSYKIEHLASVSPYLDEQRAKIEEQVELPKEPIEEETKEE